MRLRGGLALLLALASTLSGGCGRCGGERATAPERHLPAGSAAIVVPELKRAADQLSALAATLSKFPAAADLPEIRAALVAQLGLDPLDAAALRGAGLEPSAGAAVARTAAGWLAALPLGDADRFHETLGRLARDRLGAAHRTSAPVDGVPVVTFSGVAGGPAAISYAVHGGLALVAPGPGGAARAAAAARLAEAESLAGSPAWRSARAALPGHGAAVLFVPPGAWPATAVSLLRDGAALSVSAAAEALQATAVVLLPAPRLDAWRAIAAGAPERQEADLARLPPDAFLAIRFAGDPLALGSRVVWALPEAQRSRLPAAGLDVEKDLLAALAPGAAIGISLAPTFRLAAAARRQAVAAADPFRLFHVAAVARVRDEDAARRALERLAAAAPRLGLGARRLPSGAGVALSLGGAELQLSTSGDRLLVAGGDGRLDELRALSREARGYTPPAGAARDLVSTGLAAAIVDFGALSRSARALPPDAYGTGPDGFVLRSIAERILDPASRLETAAVRLELAEGAARIELRVQARPGAAVRP